MDVMNDLSVSTLALPGQIRGILSTMGPLDVLDIYLVAIILYKVYELIENTRAITLVKGLIILMVLTLFCNALNLHVIYWLLSKAVTLLFVALPIVFQPELRRGLEHIGQGRLFGRSASLDDADARFVISALDQATQKLSAQRTGALIVIERNMGLNDICASGIQIDGLVTTEFLMNVFIVNTPLHDGAAVIRGKRLIAAGCLLPLTENHSLSTELGTRHRAAIGLSEQCDALVLVVSEETGIISIAEGGRIHRRLKPEQVRAFLRPIFEPESMSLKEMVVEWKNKRKQNREKNQNKQDKKDKESKKK